MKKLMYLFFVVTSLFIISCKDADKDKPVEPQVEETTLIDDPAEHKDIEVVVNNAGGYGKEITADNAVNITKLIKEGKADGYAGKVSGKVTSTCQNKGCWMKMNAGNGSTMMITFKDYGFFVPKDISGKTIVAEGEASEKLISVEEQKHLAMDAGKNQAEIDAITEPQKELVFVADGVLILDI